MIKSDKILQDFEVDYINISPILYIDIFKQFKALFLFKVSDSPGPTYLTIIVTSLCDNKPHNVIWQFRTAQTFVLGYNF